MTWPPTDYLARSSHLLSPHQPYTLHHLINYSFYFNMRSAILKNTSVFKDSTFYVLYSINPHHHLRRDLGAGESGRQGNLKFIFSCKIVSTQVCFLTSSTEESSTFSSLKEILENQWVKFWEWSILLRPLLYADCLERWGKRLGPTESRGEINLKFWSLKEKSLNSQIQIPGEERGQSFCMVWPWELVLHMNWKCWVPSGAYWWCLATWEPFDLST